MLPTRIQIALLQHQPMFIKNVQIPKMKKNQAIWVLVSTIAGLILISLLIYIQIEDNLKLTSPTSTALILDRNGQFLSESLMENQPGLGYWPIKDDIPHRIKTVMIHTEDRRFYSHGGVDITAVFRALFHNLTHSNRQGASTIAMQIVRMQSGNRRNYWNKICEMAVAFWLISKYGHEEILKHYLRIVPQGTRFHGVAYAARRYFKKPLKDISWAEAAMLCAIPKSPGTMNLFNYKGFTTAKKRAGYILKSLFKNGLLNETEWIESQSQLANHYFPEKEYRSRHSYHAILKMEKQLRNRKQDAFDQPITSSIDLFIQDRIGQLAYNSMDYYRFLGAGNAAFVVADRKSGQILGYLGSTGYFNDEYSGGINYASTARSSGSTLKPFVYALGLESSRFEPTSILPDIPFNVKQPYGVFSINNYDERYLGPILYRKALANSRNVPAVYLLQQIGLSNMFHYFDRMGLIKDDKKESYYGLGMAIGGLYVSLEDLVSVYGILANDGKRLPLTWFKEEPATNTEKIFSTNTTRLISQFLSDPQARLPSFARMGPLEYSFPVAVKTGTSQGFRDAWAVAYSHKYIVGAWIGHPDNHRMKKVSGAYTADMVKRLMLFLHPQERRGLNEVPFPVPDGYTTAEVCGMTGETDQPDCPETFIEFVSTESQKTNLKERLKYRYAVDSRTGTIANAGTPTSAVTVRNFLKIAPNFNEWQSKKSFVPELIQYQHPLQTRINITEPLDESSFIIDPEIPAKLQTVALKATVIPNIPEIEWLINGNLFKTSPYPYVLRFPLKVGRYFIQARFPKASVISNAVTIFVSEE